HSVPTRRSSDLETQVLELAEEMVDRFGPPPPEAERYVQVMRLKTELRRLRVLGCNATRRSVTLHLRQDTPISGASLAPLVLESRGRYTLTPDGRLTRRARETETYGSGLEHAARFLLELEGAGGSAASAGVTLA